jgi:solute carrier family 25 (mitochondrial oxoglutarate transporter), member 11
MRQAVYGTARMGLYFNISEYFKAQRNGENISFAEKTAASFIAGALGSFIGNPCDLCLVRFQADSTLPEAERRNYKNVIDALGRIVAEEGVINLWRGALPTMTRAISLNVSMLVSYDTAKELATASLGKDDPFKIQVGSSMIAAVATAVCSLPFDNLKTKLQKQKAGPDGKFPYAGMQDCLTKTIAREGVTGLWAGLPTYYFRVGPHAIITLLAAEQFRTLLGVGKK